MNNITNYIFHIETQLSSWITGSLTMFGTALLFYHMSNSKTIKVHKKYAGLVSISLIIIDIMISIIALLPYKKRIDVLFNSNSASKDIPDYIDMKDEELYSTLYTILIILYIILQIVVAGMIIKDFKN